ncbi:response regulator [Pseudomonas aeruginosa]|nr:response regulator [Pseudomonas aeruginosa]
MSCSAARQALELEDIPCIGVGSAEEALQRVDRDFAGIVVSDIRLPGIDGLTLLERLKSLDPSLPVVLITGHGDISMAVQAMHAGAYDFMEKPFSPERLVEVARRARRARAGPRGQRAASPVGRPPGPGATDHRPLAGDPGVARADRQRRRHLGQRADPRRDRHRQGAGGALPPRL